MLCIQTIVFGQGFVCQANHHTSPCCYHVHPENFEAVSLADLKKYVHELEHTTCTLDIVPAKILKEAIDIIGPCLVSFINTCLSLGTVPAALKHTIVRLLPKKPNLDPSIPTSAQYLTCQFCPS